MVNEIIIPPKPELAVPFPPPCDFWKDPVTGLKIPKREETNIQWRSRLLINAEKDQGLQADLKSACAESLLFWINTFVWTLHQFDVDSETGERIPPVNVHVPFVTWPIQDDLFEELLWCEANGKDILIDKARDMGATWCCLAFLHWHWLFMPGTKMTEMSRIEDDVDKPGNEKALFQKHDYINRWLPAWMLPPQVGEGEKHRTRLHIHNTTIDSTIDGESTTKYAGKGSRRKIMLLDEFASVENGRAIRSSTRDTALMRIVNSTVGEHPGTEYSVWKKSGQIKVFKLPYWEHPQKGRGRYVRLNDKNKWDIRSPWFDKECEVRSPKEIAREILGEDVEAGDMFFTSSAVDRHMVSYGREPVCRVNVRFKPGMSESDMIRTVAKKDSSQIEVRRGNDGPLRVWGKLALNEVGIFARPDQSKRYVFGIDLSKGQGASNSVVSIRCKDTGEKIAEWADANTPPYEMAHIVMALALWCGGANPMRLPLLKWENNGPGWDFGRIVVKSYVYPYFYRKIVPGKTTEKKTDSYGFHTDPQSKYELLSNYDRAISNNKFLNPSIEALNEMKQYIYFPDGSIGPAELIEENPGAKKTHGDRVIADALSLEDGGMSRIEFPKEKIPENSFGGRMRNKIQKSKKSIRFKKFNFVISNSN